MQRRLLLLLLLGLVASLALIGAASASAAPITNTTLEPLHVHDPYGGPDWTVQHSNATDTFMINGKRKTLPEFCAGAIRSATDQVPVLYGSGGCGPAAADGTGSLVFGGMAFPDGHIVTVRGGLLGAGVLAVKLGDTPLDVTADGAFLSVVPGFGPRVEPTLLVTVTLCGPNAHTNLLSRPGTIRTGACTATADFTTPTPPAPTVTASKKHKKPHAAHGARKRPHHKKKK